MRDRTLAIVLTCLVVFVFGVPGLGLICLGSTSFLIYVFNSPLNLSSGWATTFSLFGLSANMHRFLPGADHHPDQLSAASSQIRF